MFIDLLFRVYSAEALELPEQPADYVVSLSDSSASQETS